MTVTSLKTFHKILLKTQLIESNEWIILKEDIRILGLTWTFQWIIKIEIFKGIKVLI